VIICEPLKLFDEVVANDPVGIDAFKAYDAVVANDEDIALLDD
jgi:hypothetical protein